MKKRFSMLAIIAILSTFSVVSFAQKQKSLAKSQIAVAEFGKTSVLSDGNGVWLEWNTDSEFNNLGYNVYRIEGKSKVLVNSSIIIGSALNFGDKFSGGSYEILDNAGTLNSTYIIEAISTSGENKSLGPISPEYVNELWQRNQPTSTTLDKLDKTPQGVVESNNPIVPKDLDNNPNTSLSSALSTAEATQFWIAGQNGAKIAVNQAGFYRVTRTQLQSAGFDVNASPSLWQLYANGVEQSIIVDLSGNFIEFYGVGNDLLSTDKRTYYAVVGTQPGKRIANVVRRSLREGVVNKSFASEYSRSDNQSYLSFLLNGDNDNFFGAVFNSSPTSVTLNVPSVDTTSSVSPKIDIRVQGLTNTPHSINVLLNGQQIGTITGNGYASMNLVYNIPSQMLLSGNNVVQLLTSNTNDYCLFDKVNITYPKRYVSASDRLNFSVPNYKSVKIEGFSTPNVRLFDISNPEIPIIITNPTVRPNGGTFDLSVPSNRTKMMYAITNEGFLSPLSVVANTPSNLNSVTKQANLVIVSHNSLLTQAGDWATHRRNQGMLVEVVDVEDIYDEFGFGVSGPEAIKSFFGYAKANWLVKPNYTLLVGDTTFDYRNYQGSAAAYNLVPSKLVDVTYSETVSDEYLVDFDDDGLAELAIGRIPVITGAGVTQMLNKTIAFELTRSTALMQRGAMFVSDLPNGWDFEGTNARMRQILPTAMPAAMITKAQLDSRAQILANADSGKMIIHYSGHGSAAFWAASDFYHKNDASVMNNGNNLSIFVLLTCLNGYFQNNSNDSFVEAGLKAPNGGAVATWASTGLTTPDVQEVMATRFYQKLGDGSIERIGDLIRDAKTTLVYGRDVRLSWALLGDPTLRVR
jgi:Peptidase family C25